MFGVLFVFFYVLQRSQPLSWLSAWDILYATVLCTTLVLAISVPGELRRNREARKRLSEWNDMLVKAQSWRFPVVSVRPSAAHEQGLRWQIAPVRDN